VDRTYLFVPPEEKSEVQALGAHWDAEAKCWYIEAGQTAERFSRWLPGADDGEEFTIVSHAAHVAAAEVSCQGCGTSIEVICIYCESGTVWGEALTQFTVCDVWAMDEALARQLRPWPNFRRVWDAGEESGDFANHCPRCGAAQDDQFLHSEPHEPFFDIPRAPPGSIRLTPLVGSVRLSGDEHFAMD
jgi:hypothetical protein